MAAEAAAGKANIEAKATAEAAAEALGQAAKSAAEAKEACLCKVRDQYDQSWSAIAEGAKGHAAAYEKAKNMQCVLDGTAAADCKVGKTPATSPKILSADVPEQSCTAPPTPAPTPNPTTKAPTANPTTTAPTPKPCRRYCCKATIYATTYEQCSDNGSSKHDQIVFGTYPSGTKAKIRSKW